ncbi:MAG: hypothetical protein ACK58L_17490 [Planctomycetota bacterium]
MYWLTDNPWPLILLLSGTCILLLVSGHSKARGIAVVFAVLAAGVYFLERSMISAAEQVEQRLEAMHQAFHAEDLTTINAMIADEASHLRETAKRGLELVDLDSGFHLQDVVVTLADDGRSADVELRGNGTVQINSQNMASHIATRWKTKWILQSGAWKLSEAHRLDPMTGKEIGVLDAG